MHDVIHGSFARGLYSMRRILPRTPNFACCQLSIFTWKCINSSKKTSATWYRHACSSSRRCQKRPRCSGDRGGLILTMDFRADFDFDLLKGKDY